MIDKQLQGKSNREWGKIAEQVAVEYMLANGYTIRERNFRLRTIEIDIIAQKGRNIIFVEVKARTGNHQDAVEAVDYRKQRKMINGADIYLSNLDADYFYRFDIIAITGTPENYTLQHIPDAFLPSLRRRIN